MNRIARVAFTAVTVGLSVMAAANPNAVNNSSFEARTERGQPVSWQTNAACEVIEADANHYLQVQPTPNYTPWAVQVVQVQPDWQTVVLSARMKASGLERGEQSWQTAALAGTFNDAAGERLAYIKSLKLQEDSDWVELSSAMDVPEGAKTIRLQLANFGKAGRVGFDDVKIVAKARPAPKDAAPEVPRRWGDEPVVRLSPTRGEVVLNGLWRFMPAAGPAEQTPTDTGWGYIRVPGGWASSAWWAKVPGLVAEGTGEMWSANRKELDRGWYERPITVPAHWAGRAILLDFQRVSTNARIFIDGQRVGSVNWPGGELDVTAHAMPGQPQTLRVEVLASTDRQTVIRFMETATAQVSVERAKLSVRGIAGDVVLESRPAGPHISDVFIQPSVRNRQLTFDVELTAVRRAGPATIVAHAVNERGEVEATFRQQIDLKAADTQVVQVTGPWEDPKLWDLDQPNLYTLRVAVDGGDIKDTYPQRFGFREFWIDGKDFVLNGKKVRLRPYNSGGKFGMGHVEAMLIDNARAAGFNFCELWPNDDLQRGRAHWREAFVDAADRKGMLVGGNIGYMNNHIVRRWKGEVEWDKPGGRDAFAEELARDIRKWRNHPSIVIWASSGNFFGHQRDQDPRVIGTRGWVVDDSESPDAGWHARAEAGREGIALIKRHDPTRPVFTHHGAYVGDVHTVNMYLGMIPLQEREEWLSLYAEHGTMPFMAVEFGAPVSLTLRRSRVNHAYADSSEPWATEYAAIYFGDKAYRLEDDEYREGIARFYIGEDPEHPWKFRWPEPQRNPATQELLGLFITNTWRSWRTWGMTGGMIPWIDAHGWQVRDDGFEPTDLPEFVPGQRGPYFGTLQKRELYQYSDKAYHVTPAGHALMANNSATLAWIAGPAENLALKDHNFRGGEILQKRIAVLNDLRYTARYAGKMRVTVADKTLLDREFEGELSPAENVTIPIEVELPDVDRKTDGKIHLTAAVGGVEHQDTFAFRVFPGADDRADAVVELVDPRGDTGRLLRQLGYTVRKWNGEVAPSVVVVGRGAVSDGAVKMQDLEPIVREGGRVLVMNQDPRWCARWLGLRYARHLTRHVFPVDQAHPILSGLDAIDLANWRGESHFLEPRPEYWEHPDEYEWNPRHAMPYAGWRWGGNGTLATGAIEKPHRTSWTPILECEFDLAYTALMQLDYGRGRLTWCNLDLEDHFNTDPAAEKLARNLLSYVVTAALAPAKGKTVYVGGDRGKALLDMLGVVRETGPINDETALVVIGEGETDETTVRRFVERGGTALVLPRQSAGAPFGVGIRRVAGFGGSLDDPSWPETRGISASDLRLRVDHPTWLIAAGAESAADGLIGRKRIGRGVVIYVQIDPTLLPAEDQPYYRFSRWRQTRAMSQLLANAGATFADDARIFRTALPDKPLLVDLTEHPWKVKLTLELPLAESPADAPSDPGITDAAKVLLGPDVDESGMIDVRMPAGLRDIKDAWGKLEGEVVFRVTIEVPEKLANQPLELSLGPVDDFDHTFVNGQLVGRIGAETEGFWAKDRRYALPKGLIRPGKNVIAVRMFDRFGGGGFFGKPEQLQLRPLTPDKPYLPYYHQDYRTGFDHGDDPYRYKRW